MIDALFGSKTRVKLLHLFLNNPGKSYYVREITRLIDEQINSVRRELANMLTVGVITSESSDNKLYYEVNQRYEHFVPLRAMFADDTMMPPVAQQSDEAMWYADIRELPRLRIAVLSGVLIKGSSSSVDILLVGDVPQARAKKVLHDIEIHEGRELNYTILGYDEFYYRLSVRDKFITEILQGRHMVLVDSDAVLTK